MLFDLVLCGGVGCCVVRYVDVVIDVQLWYVDQLVVCEQQWYVVLLGWYVVFLEQVFQCLVWFVW